VDRKQYSNSGGSNYNVSVSLKMIVFGGEIKTNFVNSLILLALLSNF